MIQTGGPGARLRSGPSLTAGTVEALQDGTPVVELGREGAGDDVWVRVSSPGGREGWVHADWLVFQPAASPSPP